MSFSNLVDASVFEVAQLLQFEVPGGTVDWLQQNGLLAKTRHCPKCSSMMKLRNKSSLCDGKVWGCPKKVKLISLYYYNNLSSKATIGNDLLLLILTLGIIKRKSSESKIQAKPNP